MSLTSYRAAPPRDPEEQVHNASGNGQRKRFRQKVAPPTGQRGIWFDSSDQKLSNAVQMMPGAQDQTPAILV